MGYKREKIKEAARMAKALNETLYKSVGLAIHLAAKAHHHHKDDFNWFRRCIALEFRAMDKATN
jgi:hypothetical protein